MKEEPTAFLMVLPRFIGLVGGSIGGFSLSIGAFFDSIGNSAFNGALPSFIHGLP
ncbi:hypothetical protein [Metasolibacillus fluoroglycofenilyticus]|uniref:hypothetical protein n=1 Tax=Metasolibacillus fluoroglycofenilyticus TaxID=1239396 RepID=UPI00137B3EE7|nr:hypothetical protein [Metasolibacillus fluoroglycofenilyticus]